MKKVLFFIVLILCGVDLHSQTTIPASDLQFDPAIAVSVSPPTARLYTNGWGMFHSEIPVTKLYVHARDNSPSNNTTHPILATSSDGFGAVTITETATFDWYELGIENPVQDVYIYFTNHYKNGSSENTVMFDSVMYYTSLEEPIDPVTDILDTLYNSSVLISWDESPEADLSYYNARIESNKGDKRAVNRLLLPSVAFYDLTAGNWVVCITAIDSAANESVCGGAQFFIERATVNDTIPPGIPQNIKVFVTIGVSQ